MAPRIELYAHFRLCTAREGSLCARSCRSRTCARECARPPHTVCLRLTGASLTHHPSHTSLSHATTGRLAAVPRPGCRDAAPSPRARLARADGSRGAAGGALTWRAFCRAPGTPRRGPSPGRSRRSGRWARPGPC
eukprot:3024492-Prymnesium_polylepis.1